MSLGKDMAMLSLGNGDYSKNPDMVHASPAGRLPTFKDVKKSLKVWRLIFLRAHD